MFQDSEDREIYRKLRDQFKNTKIVEKFRYLRAELDRMKEGDEEYPYIQIEIRIPDVMKEPVFIGKESGNCLQMIISKKKDIELTWKKKSIWLWFLSCKCDFYVKSVTDLASAVLDEICLIVEELGLPHLGRSS